MKRQVIISDRATDEVRITARWWRDHRSAAQADRWLAEIVTAMAGLGESAEQYPLVSERPLQATDMRQLLFGMGRSVTHRVYFRIEEHAVHVVSVRHVARKPLRIDDLD